MEITGRQVGGVTGPVLVVVNVNGPDGKAGNVDVKFTQTLLHVHAPAHVGNNISPAAI